MALQLKVPKIASSACVGTIIKAVTEIDPTAKVEADTKTKMVSIETQKLETAIKQVIAAAGYPTA